MKLIAALIDSSGDLPLFNSGPKLKKEAVIFKKSSSRGALNTSTRRQSLK